MAKPRIAIIVGSIRPNRFADHPAKWIFDIAQQRDDIEVETLDLREIQLPLFAEAGSPAWAPTESETGKRWQETVASFDGYVMVAAEYNRGPTAALKNALDYAYTQWNKKAVGFVGYGSVGGARAIEQLRLNCIELQMAPIRTGVHIQWPVYLAVAKEGKSLNDFDYLVQGAKDMLDQLVWWTNALKTAREAG